MHLQPFLVCQTTLTMLPARVLTARGYSIDKAAVTPLQRARIEKELTVTPAVPKTYATGVASFKVWTESPTRYYLPRAWAVEALGPADADGRGVGVDLPKSLRFGGTMRPHQIEALTAFRAAGHTGILCLPCGYGKTFTGIAAAAEYGKRFLIVVHKEFLADQWSEELRKLLPGARIGRIQGERCDTDCDVAIAMIQTICSRVYAPGTFDAFGFAVFDEVHHLGAEHFSQTLQRIHCRAMLGLTATPVRADGLSKVFEWYLGKIVYAIMKRPKDDTVVVEALHYDCDDYAYTEVKTDFKGDPIRACMINNIADYAPRTQRILAMLAPYLEDSSRKLLILSDRREHLVAFETGFRERGVTSIGYYVGGMKQAKLDESAEQQVILGTFAMASEGMNIPTLNAVLLATPKSSIEQSVGRILRLRPEERTVQPIIFDVVDGAFKECLGQWARRRKFYKECGYTIRHVRDRAGAAGGAGDVGVTVEEEEETPAAPAAKKGVCLISD